MKKYFYQLLAVVLMTLTGFKGFAQPFAFDVARFESRDSIAFPPKKTILFAGSSSFTNWRDVQSYFPEYPILNRAFGGSTLEDQIRYADRIIFPYEPKQVIIYCGENDLASSDTVTAAMVVERFKTLFRMIRNKLPRTTIHYVSMKPSPSRQLLSGRMIEGNEAIRKFLRKKKRAGYIDVYKEMIDDEGKPRPELFLDDNLHMKREGYVIWQRVIQPYLIK